jgi:pyruvate/2-oxoglutarate dehydrogenase complex dihydrolipoamide acyltransferase (E2) component
LVAAYRKALAAQPAVAEKGTPSAAVREPPAAYAPGGAGPGAGGGDGVRATPKAKRLAREHGLDLLRIQAETGAAIITEALLAPYLGPEKAN